MNSLNGKVALITGSSRGIGRGIAERLSELGAKVVINYSNSAEDALALVDTILTNGRKALAVRADLSRINEIEEMFYKTMAEFGQMDILINNAAVITNNPLSEVTEREFEHQFSVNVKGVFFACQQAWKHMESNGRIVNISTAGTKLTFPDMSVYASTKGAVEHLTRQLAKEFGSKQITVNAVAPGPIQTEQFFVGKSEEEIEFMKGMNSLGRMGTPVDIANAIEYLVSDKADWITGQTIHVNGGMN
jgi:3-oxoacyl-[acyl-carrier protein] reductase